MSRGGQSFKELFTTKAQRAQSFKGKRQKAKVKSKI
jgi:hypothetical protein